MDKIKINKNLIIIILILGFLILIGGIIFLLANERNIEKHQDIQSKQIKDILLKEEAKEKVLNFVKQQVPTAFIDEIISERGLYKMTIILQEGGAESVQNQEIIIYLTKDGALFFPQVIDLKEMAKVQKERRLCEKFQTKLTLERKEKIAKCLAEKGFRVYVADWCPFCRQQKEFFGEAAKYLISIDCFDPEGAPGNIAKCPDLMGVPTWKDREGNQLGGGMIQIRRLVKLSGCDY